jgi:hypothetical protein
VFSFLNVNEQSANLICSMVTLIVADYLGWITK